MRNYYTILEIQDFAGADEVKAAHRRLSKRYHPDLNNGNKQYEEKFKEIQYAYEQLRDPVTKEVHDNQLRYFYAAKNTYTYTYREPIQEQPVYTPYTPVQPVLKWRRSRGAVIAVSILAFIFFRVIFSKPWEPNVIYPKIVKTPVSIQQTLFPPPNIDTTDPYQNKFTIGSEKGIVFQIQGKPDWTTRHNKTEMWSYGNSLVVFKDDTVSNYHNIDSNLHISR